MLQLSRIRIIRQVVNKQQLTIILDIHDHCYYHEYDLEYTIINT